MRQLAAVIVGSAVFAGCAAAQHGGGGYARPNGVVVRPAVPYRTYGSGTGFGSVVFPGLASPPALANPFGSTSMFATRLGATISGYPGYNGAPSGGRRGGFGGGGAIAYPVPYPVFVGGYGYDGSYGPPQQPPPNITIVMPQSAAAPAPPVTVNQYGPGTQPAGETESDASPNIRTYQAPAREPAGASLPESDQVLFFIGLRDHTVYTALAYWVEGDLLHYITPQGKHNQVSLDLVDRELSSRLNEGRKVEFRLPPSK